MKYADKTIIRIAQERGSAAKTRAGAWKYLLVNLPKKQRGSNSGKHQWDAWREDHMDRRATGRALVLGYDPNDPNTPGRIMAEAWQMHYRWEDERTTRIYRDNYGAIQCQQMSYIYSADDRRRMVRNSLYWEARQLVMEANKLDVIPNEYNNIDFDHKGRADGDARHHELYDFGRNAAIVCIRHTEGTRYGVKTLSKTYMLIELKRSKINAIEIKIPVAKYAKMDILHYGDICAVAQGKKQIKILNATHKIHRGYKAVRKNEDGTYQSVWDGSPWVIGQTRIGAVRDDHKGGLYYYRNLADLVDATHDNGIFGKDMQHNQLAVLEVEASGVHIQYDNKLAATRITPIRHIASLI